MRGLAQATTGPGTRSANTSTDPRGQLHLVQTHLIDGPWNRGRVVLIGDAAHSCPPTIAQGAAMSLEDAPVLAELLLAADRLDEALWQRFSDRRARPRAQDRRRGLVAARTLAARPRPRRRRARPRAPRRTSLVRQPA